MLMPGKHRLSLMSPMSLFLGLITSIHSEELVYIQEINNLPDSIAAGRLFIDM